MYSVHYESFKNMFSIFRQCVASEGTIAFSMSCVIQMLNSITGYNTGPAYLNVCECYSQILQSSIWGNAGLHIPTRLS
jgi:hypothetical protein